MNSKTIRQYWDRGIECKVGDIVTVPIEILTHASTIRVDIACDHCGDVKHVRYNDYNRHNKYKGEYICPKCKSNPNDAKSKRGIRNNNNYDPSLYRIENYKNKYGIELNAENIINTYDEIQWWKWTYYGTPNGNTLRTLPNELQNINSLSSVIRYVLENEAKMNVRSQVLQCDSALLKKFKINYMTHFDGIFHMLNEAFPEYEIRPFELKTATAGYWNSIENADEYMRLYIENEVGIDTLKSKQVAKFFVYSHFKGSNYSKLPYCIFRKHFYSSFYEWVNKLYPELNLMSEDFASIKSRDGTPLNSKEEIILYDFLKYEMNINVISIGFDKSKKLYNKKCKESYMPDFIIYTDDKPILIEYYGLFSANYDGNPFLKKYYKKTMRKNKFYNALKDYHFIDIYNYELKDLNSLRTKIENKLRSFKEVS